jgi:hypothetical protein
VVAAEVKNLAAQTARATDDIAAKIAAIQSATRQTVDANGSIRDTVGEVQSSAQRIRQAMEVQARTVTMITSAVDETALAADSMSSPSPPSAPKPRRSRRDRRTRDRLPLDGRQAVRPQHHHRRLRVADRGLKEHGMIHTQPVPARPPDQHPACGSHRRFRSRRARSPATAGSLARLLEGCEAESPPSSGATMARRDRCG